MLQSDGMPERRRRRRRCPPDPEQQQRPFPDWAERDRAGDLAWIRENLHVFWPAAEQAHAEEGRGAVVVDTTALIQHEGGAGHPFGYLPQEFFEQSEEDPLRADIRRMVAEYDPTWEMVTVLLKSQNRVSSYRVGVLPRETREE